MLNIPDVYTKRLLDLADFIENLDEHQFSMRQWGQLSEPRCICGWFNHNDGHQQKDDWRHAANRLGIEDALASKLFSPDMDWTTHQAASMLRELAISGDVECLKWRGSIVTQS